MDLNNFQKDVLERSFTIPVVVDFWAEWCGPCRMLGPVIEELANEQAGRWELVKVDTEAFQEIAQQYQIRSIPNVKLFIDGKVVDEFMGAQPRSMIEKWLDKNIPSQEGLELAAVLQQAAQLSPDELIEKLQNLYQASPESGAIRIALAKALLFTQPAEAKALVENLSITNEGYEAAQDIQTIAHFLDQTISGEQAAGVKMEIAQKALKANQSEAAIQAIIDATTIDKSFDKDMPRKVAIALFRIWGDQNELNKKYRWRFDMALY